MARISGVDLPREKRIEIGLTYIYGIGRTSATRIVKEANVRPDTRVRDLTDDEIKKNRKNRHRRGLPVRGQKTKTKARTRKGPKKTVANKKK